MWRPIETAPRDGTWVLLRGGELDMDGADDVPQPPAVVGRWVNTTCPHSVSDVWGVCIWDGDWRTQYENPTHWLPLSAIEATP